MVDLSHLDGSMKTEVSFDMQQPEEFRWNHLKLNSHLKASIVANATTEKLWFAPYLFNDDNHNSSARLAVHLRAVKRLEKLEDELAAWLVLGARNSSSQSLQSATHIVQQITFGLNIIVVFDLPVSSAAEKKEMEGRLLLQAKMAFGRITDGSCSSAETITPQDISVLEAASYRVYSDLGFVNTPEPGGFSDRLKRLQQILRRTDCSCIPVEMVLFPIEAVAPLNGPKFRDVPPDALTQLSMLKTSLFQVSGRCHQLLMDPFLMRIPHFSPRLADFRNLLTTVSSKVLPAISLAVTTLRRYGDAAAPMAQVASIWKTFFARGSVLEHVVAREQELSAMKRLLDGIDLPFKSMEQLEAEYSGGAGLNVSIFILRTVQVQDPVMLCWKRELNIPDGMNSWTAFEVSSTASNQHEVLSLRDRLLSFYESSKGSLCFLSTSDSKPNGFVVSWKCQMDRSSNASLSMAAAANAKWGHPPPVDPMMRFDHQSGPPGYFPSIRQDHEGTLRPQANAFTPRSTWSDHQQLVNSSKNSEGSRSSSFHHDTSSFTVEEEEEPPEEDRVEVFTTSPWRGIYNKEASKSGARLAEEFSSCSQLLSEGSPSVFLLKWNETFTQDKKLRWFKIGMEGAKKSHKVLLLMGAKGSGKTALLNGMVNHILGVEWSDPHRFCVSEKDSGTDCVTAYTIHHVDGLKIDYSVTIIDTPGFCDAATGGDEETARIIGRFFIHPQTQLEQLTAVCFVASSCDPRPLAVQQQILESVVSLFGRDMAKSFRLLVTFSEGMKPTILEAIRAAKIPGLSDQMEGGRLQHQDFDNSSLFANNKLLDGGDNSMDRVSWNLGRANFESLFSMLAEMPSTSLFLTRQVMTARLDLKKFITALEFQLEVSCEKIEVIGQLQQLVVQFQSAMEANKDFEVEDVHYITIKTQCSWMAPSAYNCTVCRQVLNTIIVPLIINKLISNLLNFTDVRKTRIQRWIEAVEESWPAVRYLRMPSVVPS